ncbi:hypothetical protein [Deinococcus sp.]|nr:hypothetical protein [Deinococcus sp.]
MELLLAALIIMTSLVLASRQKPEPQQRFVPVPVRVQNRRQRRD